MISRENLFNSMCDQQKLWSIYTFMQSTDVEWLLSYLTDTPAESAEEPPKDSFPWWGLHKHSEIVINFSKVGNLITSFYKKNRSYFSL